MKVHVLMRDEREGRKKQARSNRNKAKQHSTPKAVTFSKKNELPQVTCTFCLSQGVKRWRELCLL